MPRRVVLLVAAMVFLPPSGLLGATPDAPAYDFASDFSADKNPSGPWMVGSFNHVFSGKLDELQNLTTYGKLTFTKTERPFGGMGLVGWGSVSHGFLGLSPTVTGVVKNTGKRAAFSIPGGSIGMFPQNGPSVVRWVAPQDGKVDVRATFVDLTKTEGYPEVWVLHNQDVASPLHYQKAYQGSGKGKDHIVWVGWKSGLKSEYHATISVAIKDTVDFVVDPMYTACVGYAKHSDGNGTDIIGLSAAIAYAVGD